MKLHLSPAVLLTTVILFAAMPTMAQTDGDAPQYQIEKLGESLYWIGTSASPWYSVLASVGDDGVLIVDTGIAGTVPLFKKALAELTDRPVKIVVLTHTHPDHTGGLAALAPDALVIVNEKGLFQEYFELEKIRTVPNATMSVTEPTTLHFNGEDIRFIPLPAGHSTDEMLIHFTDANVVAVGSRMLPQSFPFLDQPEQKYLDEYFDRIVWMTKEFPDARFASSHGQLLNTKEALEYRKGMMEITDKLVDALKSGESVESVIENGLVRGWLNGDQGAGMKRFFANQMALLSGAVEMPKPSIAKPMTEMIAKKDVGAAIKQYKKLKKKEADEWNFAEAQVNLLGYQLIYRNRLDDAMEIFKLNIEEHPESANTYDSYGEALLNAGDTTAAIEQYEKALEVNPDFVNAANVLEGLKKGK